MSSTARVVSSLYSRSVSMRLRASSATSRSIALMPSRPLNFSMMASTEVRPVTFLSMWNCSSRVPSCSSSATCCFSRSTPYMLRTNSTLLSLTFSSFRTSPVACSTTSSRRLMRSTCSCTSSLRSSSSLTMPSIFFLCASWSSPICDRSPCRSSCWFFSSCLACWYCVCVALSSVDMIMSSRLMAAPFFFSFRMSPLSRFPMWSRTLLRNLAVSICSAVSSMRRSRSAIRLAYSSFSPLPSVRISACAWSAWWSASSNRFTRSSTSTLSLSYALRSSSSCWRPLSISSCWNVDKRSLITSSENLSSRLLLALLLAPAGGRRGPRPFVRPGDPCVRPGAPPPVATPVVPVIVASEVDSAWR
mmetsp:Transcript_1432/g.3715  ORF Transcript_1432/g.3715 Transcript_1432/m.3715 type:complete len:360 (+) Transcript_1432:993-2072(+)